MQNEWIWMGAVAGSAMALLVGEAVREKHVLRLRQETLHVKQLPEAFDGLRLMQVSDLHHGKFGSGQCRIVKLVQEAAPDAIVITGDLISRYDEEFSEAEKLVRALTEIAPVYFSMGNHELDLPEPLQKAYLAMLRRNGVAVLLNETRYLERNGSRLAIAGAMLEEAIYHDGNFHYGHLSPYSVEALTACIGKHEQPTILLAHNPLIASVYAAWGAELVLSGHVHGGIVRLPKVGGLLSPERKFFPRYTKGSYQLEDTLLYVSGGLGKLRLFNPPELNLLTLRTAVSQP